MADPFLSEIRLFSFNYAPRGWAQCNGQLLPINQNTALFSLLGTTYGGNGQTTFALPDLRGRAALHFGNGFNLGQNGGEYAHTLTQNEMPQHTHALQANSAAATTIIPGNTVVFARRQAEIYHAPSNLVAMAPASVSNLGGSQPHENTPPYLTINFCIALQGIFPSRN